jgi:peptidoglycan/xylan/chitin deacetylase (PgdA/CDA1 family)
MVYFNPKKTLKQRLLFSLLLLGVFTFGLTIFFSNRHIFEGFKSYYFTSYSYVIGYKIKEAASIVLPAHVSGTEANSEGYASSVPVLVYHGVLGGNANETEGEATNVSLKTFWDQMRTLKESGWQTITMQDFYDFKTGKKNLPSKSFLLTFDDGRKESYYPADPILSALGFHAVMFVIDKYSLEENSNYYLTKDELVKMAKSKTWEIQSHGYSSHSNYLINADGDVGHFFSNKLWLPDANRNETTEEFIARTKDDLEKSKENLSQTFGKPVIAFAFPFGDYGISSVNFPDSKRIITDVTKEIYPLSFYQYSSLYRYSQNYAEGSSTEQSYMIRRIGISPQWSGNDLLEIFRRGYTKQLPFDAKFNESDGWVNTTWGTMTFVNGQMEIASLRDSTGSTVVLDGSNTWTDYEIKADVKWLKGSNIYLQARYANDDNLTSCNFKKDLVHVEQTYQGTTRVISGTENSYDPGQQYFSIGMRVKGRKVDCLINGSVVVSSDFLEDSLSTGGIGVKSWDAIPGNSDLIIKKLTVNAL